MLCLRFGRSPVDTPVLGFSFWAPEEPQFLQRLAQLRSQLFAGKIMLPWAVEISALVVACGSAVELSGDSDSGLAIGASWRTHRDPWRTAETVTEND